MWSRKYPDCVVCGRSDRPHVGFGKCRYCYMREYVRDRAEEMKTYKHFWYVKFVKGTDRQKIVRERSYFSSKREEILKRDNYQCVKCKSNESLVVHHKDGQGRSVKIPNNDIENLETLCRKCHMKEHEVRSLKKFRTHCRKGHQYTEKNTYIVPGYGWRHCRACTNENARRYSRIKRSRSD